MKDGKVYHTTEYNGPISISMESDKIQIGCTTIDAAVLHHLADLHAKEFISKAKLIVQ